MTDSPDEDPLAFTPVPNLRPRHDGWSAERQRMFIQALAVMGAVASAARAAGMSVQSAHMLRKRPGADSFAAAWDAALFQGRQRVWDIAMDRALNGVVKPRFYRGRQVGTKRSFDYRLGSVLNQLALAVWC
jgi:hypothetical protein